MKDIIYSQYTQISECLLKMRDAYSVLFMNSLSSSSYQNFPNMLFPLSGFLSLRKNITSEVQNLKLGTH